MYVQIKNENFGYDVTTYGDYVVASNPAVLKYDFATASIFKTGSVDYFRYNRNTDEHDYIGTLYKPKVEIDVLLARELNRDGLKTEAFGPSATKNKGLLIDKNNYTASVDDGFGLSLDMVDKQLMVGSPYYTQLVMTSASIITASGASVHFYDLGISEYANFTPTSSLLVFSIDDPDINNLQGTSGSFGTAVSINRQWALVGSPRVSGSNGMVYIYRNQTTGSNYNWYLFQKLDAPTGAIAGAEFGASLKLNKCTGSCSQSLVVGCGNKLNTHAYYYELITGSWTKTFTFYPDDRIQPLTFADYQPYNPVEVTANGFGQAVSLYGQAVIVGEPYDRMFYEYSGSSLYQQGSVYIFERCPQGNPTINYIPRFPNSSISFGVADTSHPGLVSGNTTVTESHSHATIQVGNKLYGGGWDGYIYVLKDPDGDLNNRMVTHFIGGTGISAVCYSDVTGYLYFVNGGAGTGYIVKVDPNDITNQSILVSGLGGYPALVPICTDGNYLYTVVGNYFRKIDVHTGATVAQAQWLSASIPVNGAHSSVMAPDKKYFYVCNSGGKMAKVSTTNLTSITKQLYTDYPTGPFFASTTDDIAYLDGYVYATVESNGNIFKINADDLSYTSYRAARNSFGVYADDQHVYLLQGKEVWVYPYGDLDSGPVRFYIPAVGYSANEMWQTDGGNFVFTEWAGSGKILSYRLPWRYEVPAPTRFDQVLKTYGNQYSLKNNRLGFSVDMYGNNAVAGSPKINVLGLTSCYVGGTLEQLHQCNSDLENLLNGQAMLLQKNTSSLDWGITNIYQKKKKYLSPYRSYGFDVAIADKSMVVGAPIYMFDPNRQVNISTTASNNVTLDDVTGKAYIYNLHNLRDQFHVGNVFYRNGKIVLMTSGSVFDGLFFNPVNTVDYEYDLQFKGQHTIFEKQVVCTVNPGEFNVSTNPTSILPSTASLDINQNGRVDYQDIDIVLRYMQYKNTSFLGVPVTTDWSSSVVVNDDEKSLLRWYEQNYNDPDTGTRTSASIVLWETTDTQMQTTLDLNQDNKIDVRDMNIMWKYFANRLTQENYASYITPACKRKLFSDIVDYMDFLTQKSAKPLINPTFMQYEHSTNLDKTGSFLAPMATSIGLYSGLDLVGIAKLGNPIKITPELPINFVVKMDF